MITLSSVDNSVKIFKAKRSHSAQDFVASGPNSAMKIPMPPRLWITGLCYYATNICISALIHKTLLQIKETKYFY